MEPDETKHDQDDRISRLPDGILLNILNRLQLSDAARTGILSRRWRQLPGMLSELFIDIDHFLPEDCTEFTEEELDQSSASLVEAMKSILACRSDSQYTIRSLSIKFYLRDDHSISIGQTVANTMVTNKVDGAELIIMTMLQSNQCDEADFVEYGRQFNLFFESYPNVFGGLTHLQLQNLRFGDADVPNILTTCKKLVFFSLESCDTGIRTMLQVDHAELNKLKILGCRYEMVVLKCLPKLTQLTFTGWISKGYPFSFGYVPLLQTVHLANISLSWHKMLKLGRLLRCAPSLCNLHLNFRSEKIWIPPEGPKGLVNVFHKLRFVNLIDIPEGYDLSWTMSILEGAPYLKKLYVTVRDHFCGRVKDERKRRERTYSEKKSIGWETPSDFKHQSLTLLAFFGFQSEEYFVEYIRRVMQVAVNLEDAFLYRTLVCRMCVGTVVCRYPRTKQQQRSLRNRITKGTNSLAMIHFPAALFHYPETKKQFS